MADVSDEVGSQESLRAEERPPRADRQLQVGRSALAEAVQRRAVGRVRSRSRTFVTISHLRARGASASSILIFLLRCAGRRLRTFPLQLALLSSYTFTVSNAF